MKLLTHNMLACHIRGVENGYPFKIEAVEVARHPAEYDPDFLRHILPRLEWPALLEGAKAVELLFFLFLSRSFHPLLLV
jgi:multifunctional methyltransferase subunit TRM112